MTPDAPVKAELKTLSPSRREIELEIPAEATEAEAARLAARYAATVKLAGFRKGKAPLDMVKTMFRDDIRHDVVDELVPRVLHEELESRHLHPVAPPEMEDLDYREDGLLRTRISFEVLPEFELPDTGRIKVTARPEAVAGEHVDKLLEDLRARAAEYVPVAGRGVADGDYVVVRVQGTDAKARKKLPAEQAVVLAGHAGNEPGINEHLAGAAAGEERRFETAYPADHPRRRLAGKTIEYALEVKEIKERRLPAADDEFAKGLGEASLDALKAKLRSQLEESARQAARNAAAAEALKEIGARANVEIPGRLVEKEADAILRRALEGTAASRLSEEALGKLRAEARERARQSILNHLILEKIAARERLEVTEAEVRAEVASLADANGLPAERLYESLDRESRLEEVRERLLFRRAIDFLTRGAIMEAPVEKG